MSDTNPVISTNKPEGGADPALPIALDQVINGDVAQPSDPVPADAPSFVAASVDSPQPDPESSSSGGVGEEAAVDVSASYWDVTTPPIKDAVPLAVDDEPATSRVTHPSASFANPIMFDGGPATGSATGPVPDPVSAPVVSPIDAVTPSAPVAPPVAVPVTPALPANDVPDVVIPPTTLGQSSLDLGPDPWTPTPSASEYLGLSSAAPVTPPVAPLPPYGQSSMGSTSSYGSASTSPAASAEYTSYPQTSYAQTAPVGSSMPSYGQSAPYDQGASYGGSSYGQPEAGYSNYQNYSATSPTPPQPIYPTATPAMPVMYGTVALVPGQMIQTPYGPRMVGTKSKLAAGLLGIFLGGLGVGRFYRGFVGLGVLQILANIFFGAGWLWAVIEGIVVLCSSPGSASSLDSEGRVMS